MPYPLFFPVQHIWVGSMRHWSGNSGCPAVRSPQSKVRNPDTHSACVHIEVDHRLSLEVGVEVDAAEALEDEEEDTGTVVQSGEVLAMQKETRQVAGNFKVLSG